MTDKEKIELIIQDKHLNNTEFCNEVCISPGTLSHIRSGRTEPTLNILRSIAQAFPDINPAWLFYGEGSMYKETNSPTLEGGNDGDTYINNVEETGTVDGQDMPLFKNLPSSSPSQRPNGSTVTHVAPTTSSQVADTSRRSVSPQPATSPLNVQEIVAETLKQQQKQQRKVVEVRIFFDDGTFETFSAN